MFKNFNINTAFGGNEKNKFGINNVCSFPALDSTKSIKNNSTSTTCEEELKKNKKQILSKNYTISLDWFQFVCSAITHTSIILQYWDSDIVIDRVFTHHNPNFLECYRVYHHNDELFELYRKPTNDKYKTYEIMVKVANHMLYTHDWTERVEDVLEKMQLVFLRINSIAIAIDGEWNMKVMIYCRRYVRTHSMQINNDNISIEPKKFKKKDLKWEEYLIGSTKSQKYCRVYNKMEEIMKSGKDYIIEYWENNNVAAKNIGRFELQLQWKILKKYKLNSIREFQNPALLSEIFQKEVRDWIEFRTVKREYLKNHKKEIAFKKGQRKQLVWWKNLPQTQNLLQEAPVQQKTVVNIKRGITTILGEIRNDPTATTTDDLVNAVICISSTYSLDNWRSSRIHSMFTKNGIDPIPIFSGASCTHFTSDG